MAVTIHNFDLRTVWRESVADRCQHAEIYALAAHPDIAMLFLVRCRFLLPDGEDRVTRVRPYGSDYRHVIGSAHLAPERN